jgi:parvulin-like peptidyl-prolyl isomerase
MIRTRFLLPVAWVGGVSFLGTVASEAGAQEPPAPAPAQEKPAEPAPGLPAGVLARVNGRDITVDDYVGYLLASTGKSKLDEYIDRLLIDDEARRLGISVTPAEIEGRVKDLVERTVKAMYRGDEARFAEELRKRHTTVEDYKAKARQDLYYDRLYEAVIVKNRVVDEAALRREFVEVYGEDGVEHVLRHVLVAIRGGAAAETARSESEAKERAARALEEVRSGTKGFTEAVKEYSDDAYSRSREGRILHYRKGVYGESFDLAVAALTPEEPTSGVVVSPRGCHIIQLAERRTTRFEDVKKDLEEALATKPPTREERRALVAELRARAKIEGL